MRDFSLLPSPQVRKNTQLSPSRALFVEQCRERAKAARAQLRRGVQRDLRVQFTPTTIPFAPPIFYVMHGPHVLSAMPRCDTRYIRAALRAAGRSWTCYTATHLLGYAYCRHPVHSCRTVCCRALVYVLCPMYGGGVCRSR